MSRLCRGRSLPPFPYLALPFSFNRLRLHAIDNISFHNLSYYLITIAFRKKMESYVKRFYIDHLQDVQIHHFLSFLIEQIRDSLFYIYEYAIGESSILICLEIR